MARQPHHHQHHRDRDPDHPEREQPRRRYDHPKDYFSLQRFRPDFGSAFNVANYWGEKLNSDGRDGGRR